MLLPTYEVGGDWFDFVENRDGAWLAIADASGTGPTAAGLGAAVLGALRAARRSGNDLKQALALMNDTVRRLEHETFEITTWLARWRAATGTLSWVNCGHPAAYLVDADGELTELAGLRHPALGKSAQPTYRVTEQALTPGQRVIIVTNGITQRKLESGGTFGVDGIKAALDRAENQTAAATAMAIQQAVTDCWKEPLEDDGTILVMAVD